MSDCKFKMKKWLNDSGDGKRIYLEETTTGTEVTVDSDDCDYDESMRIAKAIIKAFKASAPEGSQ